MKSKPNSIESNQATEGFVCYNAFQDPPLFVIIQTKLMAVPFLQISYQSYEYNYQEIVVNHS